MVKGLDIGVSTMKLGEQCRLCCRSDYGYGKKGLSPSVPSESTITFDVELLSWQGKRIKLVQTVFLWLFCDLYHGTSNSTENNDILLLIEREDCHDKILLVIRGLLLP